MASSDLAEADAVLAERGGEAPDPAYVRTLEVEVAGLRERVERLERERDRAETRLARRRAQLEETEADLERTREWAAFLEVEVRERREASRSADGLLARLAARLPTGR